MYLQKFVRLCIKLVVCIEVKNQSNQGVSFCSGLADEIGMINDNVKLVCTYQKTDNKDKGNGYNFKGFWISFYFDAVDNLWITLYNIYKYNIIIYIIYNNIIYIIRSKELPPFLEHGYWVITFFS